MLILSASLLPLLVFVATRQLCDGLRYPRVAMAITLSALAVNALFNYLLIKGVGPFPALGLMGSAMATLLSRLFMAGAMLVYVYRTSHFRAYLKKEFNALPTASEAWIILRLGIPGGLTFFFEVATFSLAVVIVGWLGEAQLAAHQIAINMASVTYMMATGISSAAAIRVSAAVGRVQPRRCLAGRGSGLSVIRKFYEHNRSCISDGKRLAGNALHSRQSGGHDYCGLAGDYGGLLSAFRWGAGSGAGWLARACRT